MRHSYALAHVAGYGKALGPAARDTWDALQRGGVQSVLDGHDRGGDMTEELLARGCVGSSGLVVLFACGYWASSSSSLQSVSSSWAVLAFVCYCVAYASMSTATKVKRC
jgi:hypothetical protein